eukprot:COSAG06_NODE_2482_length_6793_cov_10.570511_3_plen_81_part_00
MVERVSPLGMGVWLTLDGCMSCTDQWDVQATVKRINESLIERGYVTWFDLTNMKGIASTLSLQLSVAFLLNIAADRPYTH